VTGGARRRPQAVLLDALGTLLYLEPPAPRLQASLRARLGLGVGEDRCEAAMRAEMRHYAAECSRAGDDGRLAALRLECADVLADALGLGLAGFELLPCLTDAIAFTAYPDAAPALDALAGAGLRLAVVSNWDVSLAQVLDRLRLGERFECVTHSAELGVGKPDPRIFRLALARLELGPEQVVHVGDDPINDIAGATSAGVPALLLGRASGGDLRTLAELPELLGVCETA